MRRSKGRSTGVDPREALPFPLSDVSNGEWCPRPPNREAEARRRAAARRRPDRRASAPRHVAARAFCAPRRAPPPHTWCSTPCTASHRRAMPRVLPVRPEQCDDPAGGARAFQADYFVMDVQLHHVDSTVFNYPHLACAALPGAEPVRGGTPAASLPDQHGQGGVRRQRDGGRGDQRRPERRAAAGRYDGGDARPGERARRLAARPLAGDVRSAQPARAARPRSASLEHQVRDLGARASSATPATATGCSTTKRFPIRCSRRRRGSGSAPDQRPQGLPCSCSAPWRTTTCAAATCRRCRRTGRGSSSSPITPAISPGRRASTSSSASCAQIPHRRNVYAEIGSSFAIAMTQGPTAAAHFIGSLLADARPERIVWGTDSIWWGSPQWQIDAFKVLTIPPAMQEEFGYPPLTERDKRQHPRAQRGALVPRQGEPEALRRSRTIS